MDRHNSFPLFARLLASTVLIVALSGCGDNTTTKETDEVAVEHQLQHSAAGDTAGTAAAEPENSQETPSTVAKPDAHQAQIESRSAHEAFWKSLEALFVTPRSWSDAKANFAVWHSRANFLVILLFYGLFICHCLEVGVMGISACLPKTSTPPHQATRSIGGKLLPRFVQRIS